MKKRELKHAEDPNDAADQAQSSAHDQKILPDQTTSSPPIKMQKFLLPESNQDKVTTTQDDDLEELPDLEGDVPYLSLPHINNLQEYLDDTSIFKIEEFGESFTIKKN